MWALDPANSRDLIDRLRPHARNRDFEVAHVGEGWRPLVEECHERLEAAFPDHELLAIKQKWGVLAYQAFPRRWAEGQRRCTSQEHSDLGTITDQIRDRSEHICEWCGSAGQLREWRKLQLTLCDACDQRFPDPPYPVHGPLGALRRRDPPPSPPAPPRPAAPRRQRRRDPPPSPPAPPRPAALAARATAIHCPSRQRRRDPLGSDGEPSMYVSCWQGN